MKLDTRVQKGFPHEEGPFVRCLDGALKSFNVHREAYFGGTFVGNQVHRTLKVQIKSQLNEQSNNISIYTLLTVGERSDTLLCCTTCGREGLSRTRGLMY